MNDENLTAKKEGQTDTTWWLVFLNSLRNMPNVSKACRAAGVSRTLAYSHRDMYVDFGEAWADALKEGVERWEELAAQRAFEGVTKPLMYEGKVVHKVQEFSDTLAIFLLKAHDPEKYRERSEIKTDGTLDIKIRYEEGE